MGIVESDLKANKEPSGALLAFLGAAAGEAAAIRRAAGANDR